MARTSEVALRQSTSSTSVARSHQGALGQTPKGAQREVCSAAIFHLLCYETRTPRISPRCPAAWVPDSTLAVVVQATAPAYQRCLTATGGIYH